MSDGNNIGDNRSPTASGVAKQTMPGFHGGMISSWSKSWLIQTPTRWIVDSLESLGVPEYFLPLSEEEVCRSLIAVTSSLVLYFVLFGYRHWKRQRRLQAELEATRAHLETIQGVRSDSHKEEIRIFMDGAFDLMHFGHMNAFRLAKSLGTHLVVGINSDQSITECKGAPLMNDEERLTMVKSCKFVDQVVPDCPYIMNQEYLDWVIREHKIDYVVHGDDPCIVDGKDVYATAKERGNFRTIPRTEGVSTTDIVGRILLLTKGGHQNGSNGTILGEQSKFLTTSRLLGLFSARTRSPTQDMRVVYVDGAWDLLHPGHVAKLEAAKKRGDYLIVGIYGDKLVNQQMGRGLPLLNIHERVLGVLGCRFVDEVLIDAPYQVSPEMISSLNLQQVIGWKDEDAEDQPKGSKDRYRFAEQTGIFMSLPSPSNFRLERVVERIQKDQDSYEAKFERKMKAETQFYQEKYGGSSSRR